MAYRDTEGPMFGGDLVVDSCKRLQAHIDALGLVTANVYARQAEVSVDTVRRWYQAGKIPGVRTPLGLLFPLRVEELTEEVNGEPSG